MMQNKNQNGASLVEVIVAILVGVMAVVILTSMMLLRSQAIDLGAVTKVAVTSAESGLLNLTSKINTVTETESFTLRPNETTIDLLPCQPDSCDFVLEPDAPESEKTSLTGGVPYRAFYQPPVGSHIQYVRRWRVQSFNSQFHLKSLELAILPDISSNQPILLIKTTVGFNN